MKEKISLHLKRKAFETYLMFVTIYGEETHTFTKAFIIKLQKTRNIVTRGQSS